MPPVEVAEVHRKPDGGQRATIFSQPTITFHRKIQILFMFSAKLCSYALAKEDIQSGKAAEIKNAWEFGGVFRTTR
jgi:hypothetical protein